MMTDFRKRLDLLEKESRKLDPVQSQRRVWEVATIEQGNHYLEKLHHAPTAVIRHNKARELLAYPIQEEPREMEGLMELLSQTLESQGLKPGSGGYMAYIPGGGVYPSALGDYLAAVGNHYAGVFFASPTGVRMENMLIKWVAKILGFDPEKAGGNLASGGSYASLIALHTARVHKGIKSRDLEKTVIYLSEQTHHCIDKALRVAGMSECIIRRVPLDDQYRMIPESMDQLIQEDLQAGLHPFMVVCSLGTTDVGAIDPIDTIRSIAHRHDLWVHVDAAYGGFFGLCPEMQDHFKGLGKVDSLVIDPHKSLFIALGTGIVIVREVEHLVQAYTGSGSYMQDAVDKTEYSPADLSPELTKHFRGLRMWLSLQLFGVAPFRAALQEKRLLTLYAYEALKQMPDIELPLIPELTVILYRFLPEVNDINAYNQQLMQLIQEDGRVFMSSTTINGAFYLRLTILHFRTHKSEVDKALQLIREKVAELNQAE